MSIWDQLKQYEEAFAKAEVKETTSYDNLPDGKYVVRIERAAVEESKAGRPQMVWELVVEEGSYKGRHLWKYNGLDSIDKITWLKQDFFQAGFPVESLNQVQELLPKLLDQYMKITLKTKTNDKGSFQNVFFNGSVGADHAPRKTESAPVVLTDSDLPF